MEPSLRCRRRRPFTVAGLFVAIPVLGAACGFTGSRAPSPEPTRARAYLGTFDRILIAGFLAEHVPGRGRDLDLNAETSRLLRMTLRSKGPLDVIESEPLHLPPGESPADPDAPLFSDVPFWKRVGEEYREPLILTGTIAFRRDGPQSIERQAGPRSVTVLRPRYRLDLRLVFISGRTGEVLESLPLAPLAARAMDARSSALALYFELMDRLAPSVVALFGYPAAASR